MDAYPGVPTLSSTPRPLGLGRKLFATNNFANPIIFTSLPQLFYGLSKMPTRYWLMKTEPTTYSIDDLAAAPDQTTCWEGVRNYQARNLLRDEIQAGDRVLFYHSACKEPAVVGTAIVVRSGYPDHHAQDKRSKYYDPQHDPNDPRWYMVDITLEQKFDHPVTLAALRQRAGLKDMVLLQKGSRLSVQPVKKTEFDTVVKMARAD